MNPLVAHYFPKNKELDDLDIKRINYTVQVNLGMFGLFAGLLLIHLVCKMGSIHYTGDIVGMLGVLISLRLIRQDNIETAQRTLIWAGIVCVCLYGPVIDWYAEASVHFLRVYVTLFAMVGILILMITFFIEKVNYTLYGLIFSVILVVHFWIIINYFGGIHAVTPEIVSYFTIAIASVNMVAFVCNTMVRFNSSLIRQIREDNRQIMLNNAKLEQKVAERTKELLISNENLENYAHVLSHDLQEPVRTILSFSRLLIRKIKEDKDHKKEYEEYVEFIAGGANHLHRMITDILTLSKIDGQGTLFEDINMNELLDKLQLQLNDLLESNNAKLHIQPLHNIRGERVMIFQLFQNLVINAIRYKSSTQAPFVEISSRQGEDYIEFCVKDNGMGISPENLELIFQPFRRVSSERKTDGTGLGLSICEKIVKVHQGTISVKSEPGKGSQFCIRFPCDKPGEQ